MIGGGIASGWLMLGARTGLCISSEPPAGGGEYMTTTAMCGPWAWPNTGETQYMIFADPSWMEVGQSLEIDDGVHTPGVMNIVTIVPGETPEEPTIVECGWTTGPAGGTTMLDGAAVLLL